MRNVSVTLKYNLKIQTERGRVNDTASPYCRNTVLPSVFLGHYLEFDGTPDILVALH